MCVCVCVIDIKGESCLKFVACSPLNPNGILTYFTIETYILFTFLPPDDQLHRLHGNPQSSHREVQVYYCHICVGDLFRAIGSMKYV